MIENFEEITSELSVNELIVIPYLVRGFKGRTKDNPIKAPEIVSEMNSFLKNKGIDVRLTEPRLRKCVNHIRQNALIPLIATSNGYFVSFDEDVIRSQVKSLRQRAHSIDMSADGLEYFLFNDGKNNNDPERKA